MVKMTTDGAYARLALYAPHQGGQSALIDSRARTSCQTTLPKRGEGGGPSAQHYDSLPYLEPSAGAAVPRCLSSAQGRACRSIPSERAHLSIVVIVVVASTVIARTTAMKVIVIVFAIWVLLGAGLHGRIRNMVRAESIEALAEPF